MFAGPTLRMLRAGYTTTLTATPSYIGHSLPPCPRSRQASLRQSTIACPVHTRMDANASPASTGDSAHPPPARGAEEQPEVEEDELTTLTDSSDHPGQQKRHLVSLECRRGADQVELP